MRLLLAAPNRDLLQSCQKLLNEDFGETVAAFDGPQLLKLLAEGDYTLAILDRSLPRVRYELLLRELRREGLAVITLLDGPLHVKDLVEEPLPEAFLSYPFETEELRSAIRSVLRLREEEGPIPFAGTTLEPSRFRLGCGAALTAGEIGALKALLAGQFLRSEDAGVCVSALRHKLERHAVRAQIRYEAGKGFRLVTDHE